MDQQTHDRKPQGSEPGNLGLVSPGCSKQGVGISFWDDSIVLRDAGSDSVHTRVLSQHGLMVSNNAIKHGCNGDFTLRQIGPSGCRDFHGWPKISSVIGPLCLGHFPHHMAILGDNASRPTPGRVGGKPLVKTGSSHVREWTIVQPRWRRPTRPA